MSCDTSGGRPPRAHLLWRILAAVGSVVLLLGLAGTAVAEQAQTTAHPAISGTEPQLSAAQVAAAFRTAGLPMDNLRQQPVGGGSPSGPPQTEREAWAFSVPGVAPSGGRILVFSDDDKLHKKAAWFNRVGVGAAVLVHGNVILWLDPAMDPGDVARYRQVLQGLR